MMGWCRRAWPAAKRDLGNAWRDGRKTGDYTGIAFLSLLIVIAGTLLATPPALLAWIILGTAVPMALDGLGVIVSIGLLLWALRLSERP